MWDKDKTVNISTVSETFGVPASTLRYWESMGLFSLERGDNNYREYTYSSLLDLSDICHMRNLGIPIKAIKEYRRLNLEDSNKLYLKKKSELEMQIENLQGTYSMLCQTLDLMEELKHIQDNPYAEAKPDVSLLISHSKLYDREVWKKYFAGHYQFAGVCLGPPDYRWIWGWAAEFCRPDEELVWSLTEEERRFVQYIMRIDTEDRRNDNLSEAVGDLAARGYTAGEIVARYITTAYDGRTRWDYYKAWIECV